MNPSNKLLSDITAFRSYAKFLPNFNRREVLEETINRDMTMHLDRFPKLSKEIIRAFSYVHELKILPSMRSLQFAGDAIIKNNLRAYNCSYEAIDSPDAFAEILFLLLSGAGVGYSVQHRHIRNLPRVQQPRQEGIFVVQDSIAGWAEAVDVLIKAYLYNRVRPVYDFRNISAKGTYLITTGTKAPGHEALKYMLQEVETRLKKAIGRYLRSTEINDIICLESDCVLSGGVRRSSLICLFDRFDRTMLYSKSGDWWVNHPYRARANISAVLPRNEVSEEEFKEIYRICKESNSGEPGFFWTNNLDMGTNPCAEIGLNSFQLCNLTTINQTDIEGKKDFLSRVMNATFLGTLQATYTDFPYVRPVWRQTTEAEALLGVSFTGIADAQNSIPAEWVREGAQLTLDINEKYARKLGINLAARIGTIKPDGSSSCVFGSASGIHDRHDAWYIRRVRISKNDSLAHYLDGIVPELMEDDKYAPNTVVLSIPQESPPGAAIRSESTALKLFDRVKMYYSNWILPSHRSGDNTHNVSCTINVRENEWDDLGNQLWLDRDKYAAISLLPYDTGIYVQAPFESCSKEKYDELSVVINNVDLRDVIEESDNTNRMQQLACVSGMCEIV